jgi:hypothetical protein
MVVTPTPVPPPWSDNKGLDSKPDGYTIFLAAQSTMSIGAQIRKVRFTWETRNTSHGGLAQTSISASARSRSQFKYLRRHHRLRQEPIPAS